MYKTDDLIIFTEQANHLFRIFVVQSSSEQ